MRRVDISQARPGETVARPVVATAGVVLMQPGTVLTAELLPRLVSLGVDTLWLDGQDPDAEPLERTLAELDRRFAGYEENALMMQLKAVIASRYRSLAGEGCDG